MNYSCITNYLDVIDFLHDVPVVAFDIETSPLDIWRSDPKASLDSHKSAITGCSFASENESIYVPFKHRCGTNVNNQEKLWEFLKGNIFESEDVIKIAHNLAFESSFFYAKGIMVQKPCYDTIAAAQMTLKSRFEFRNLTDSGLKRLATEQFSAVMTSFENLTDGRFFDELNPQDKDTIRYACADSDYAMRLYLKFNNWFDSYLPAHRTVVEDLESPTSVYVGMMKHNGIPVEKETIERAMIMADAKIAELESKILSITGNITIGSNCSTVGFKNFLYNTLSLPVLKTTDKHQPSLDDEALLRLADYCKIHKPDIVPLFGLVIDYRKWQKLQSTYFRGYHSFINDATGRIHPSLQPLATKTGRFSCSLPNMQNSPQPSDDPIGVRNFIVAPDGWKIIEADYSQAEIRLCAFLSGDEVLLEAYRQGMDIHAITTSAIFKIPLEEAMDEENPLYKRRRKIAKATMFGIMYGIGAAGLSKNLYANAGITVSKEDCDEYIKGILSKYKGMARWQKEQRQQIKSLLYTETAMGRRRYLPEILSNEYYERGKAERMAINTPVQGLCADCLKQAMALLIKELRGREDILPILTVHDSLVFLVKDAVVDESTDLIKKCMEAPLPLPGFTPLVAEVSVGHKYGEMHAIK